MSKYSMSNCYFCHGTSIDVDQINFECFQCSQKYNLYKVYTSYYDKEVKYAHIYPYLTKTTVHHVRLEFENNTSVLNLIGKIFTVPRIIINGKNIDKTYNILNKYLILL